MAKRKRRRSRMAGVKAAATRKRNKYIGWAVAMMVGVFAVIFRNDIGLGGTYDKLESAVKK